VNIKGILLALLVASLFAYIGLAVNSDLATTYGVTMSDAKTNETFGNVQKEASIVSGKVQQVNAWLQDLTEGNLLGFVYAMPTNIANVLGIFLTIPNIAYSVFDATLSSFGIPSFVTGIISVMLIITVILIIVNIWTEGRA
jgi:hypothetical protein